MGDKVENLDEQEEELFEVPQNPMDFLSEIINSYPKDDYLTLRKVIGLGKVVYQDQGVLPGSPMTAAVMNTKPYTLIFGKEFMQKNMKTTEDCVYILSHELTHLMLDHFAKDILEEFDEKELGHKAMHIVVDCQVNATVYNSLKEDKYLEFIKRYYSETEMPYCFFRPDGKPETKELQELHKQLYSEDGITNKDLIDGLMDWFKEKQDELEEMVKKCLGNHKDLLKDRSGNSKSDELDDLSEAIAQDTQDYLKKKKEEKEAEKKKASGEGDEGDKGKDKEGDDKEGEGKKDEGGDNEDDSGTQAGKGGQLREQIIKNCLDRIQYAKNIKRKLKKMDVISPSSRIFKAIDDYVPKRPMRSVVPNFHDRRTAALYSLGKMPIFHQTPAKGSNVVVPCYVDVSGSQSHVLPHVLPVVSRLKDKIGHLVYCFSTVVAETRINNLAAGKYETTGGTDFNPVARHIIKNRFRSAVILTDGQAWLDDQLIAELRRRNVKITVGWTVNRPDKDPLSKIAKKTFFVFDKNSSNAYDY